MPIDYRIVFLGSSCELPTTLSDYNKGVLHAHSSTISLPKRCCFGDAGKTPSAQQNGKANDAVFIVIISGNEWQTFIGLTGSARRAKSSALEGSPSRVLALSA